jgi:hypothetical protein
VQRKQRVDIFPFSGFGGDVCAAVGGGRCEHVVNCSKAFGVCLGTGGGVAVGLGVAETIEPVADTTSVSRSQLDSR